MRTEEKLQKMILEVFEEPDYFKVSKEVKAEKCIELIAFCQKLDPTRPEGFYGNQKTGLIRKVHAIRMRELLYSM